MTLSELLAELRARQAVVGLTTDLRDGALLVEPEPTAGYIPPEIKFLSRPRDARVLLVDAIGAVGKSAAARQIASHLNWPIVDSARAQVGSYSLSGLLHDSLGFESTFMAEVSRGMSGLVIDSLDEAHLRAGTSNLAAFLENVTNLASVGVGRGISIIMLSRPDTADMIDMLFEDRSWPLARARIEFFNYERAKAFIRSYLERVHGAADGTGYAVAAEHPQAFADLRNKRLRFIAEAMCGETVASLPEIWPRVQHFLGYAPVLEVLAEALAVPNPYKASKEVSAIAASSHKILLSLVEELLQREQQKFETQVKDQLVASLPVNVDWSPAGLYTPEEQVHRLVQKVTGGSDEIQVDVPDQIRAQYERSVTQFLLDHPFVSGDRPVNVVFSDYLTCHRCTLPDQTAVTDGDVGPFFFRFAHALFPRDGESSEPVATEEHARLLIASLSLGLPSATGVAWLWLQSDERATLQLLDSYINEYFEFEIVSLSGAFAVPTPLSRALVVSDESVILDADGERYMFGPYALVISHEVIFDASVLQVGSGYGDGPPPNRIIADKFDPSRLISVESPDPAALALSEAGDAWPLLRQYCKESDSAEIFEYSAYVDLRAIIRSFGQGAGGAPSVFAQKLDQRIVKSNERRIEFLDALLATKVLTKSGQHYYLNTSALSQHSVNLQSLTNGQPNEHVFEFIRWLKGQQSAAGE